MLLLLVIALAPLTMVSFLDVRATSHLGENLANRTSEAIIREVGFRLQQWIDEKAEWARAGRNLIQQTLRFQAREVERNLALSSAPATRIFENADFERDPSPVPGLEESRSHFRYDEGRAMFEPLRVSYAALSFHFSPGTPRGALGADVRRLAAMLEFYRVLHASPQELIHWQYTGLENGLFCSYPGHGGYADDYDPRLRPWYIEARQKGEFTWFGPYVDASSKELVLTACQPIRRHGVFAGVTALDITVRELVGLLQPPSSWPKGGRAMLVALEQRHGRTELLVRAQPEYAMPRKASKTSSEAATLESSDAAGLQKLAGDLEQNRSGLLRMPYEGKECLWIYGPIRGENLHLVAIVPYEEVIAEAKAAQQDAIQQTRVQMDGLRLMFAFVILALLLAALIGSRAVTRPIRDLADAARRVGEGRLDTRVDIRTRDEIEELGQAFNQMAPQLQERLVIKHSLELAREVQQQLLPSAPPRIAGLDVAGRNLSCDETGGDYFDFIEISGEPPLLAVAVGDITGHGIASAMLMAGARGTLRACVHRPVALGGWLTRLNQQFSGDVSGGRFLTLFLLLVDPRARAVRWASAGHDGAILFSPASGAFDELGGGGLPLGIEASANYEEFGPRTLNPGDVLVIGTDGIWEAANPRGERFGKEALREVIRRHARLSAGEMVRAIHEAVADFREGLPPADDVTVVVLRVTDPV